MTNSQPSDPQMEKPPDPQVEKTWVNAAGELFIFNGTDWIPYEDLPDWPDDDDPDSKALYRDT